MLIHDTLPSKYTHNIQFVYNNYKNNNLNGESSLHYWIDNIKDKELLEKINIIRNAPEIIRELEKNYPGYKIITVHESDEIYFSVSPSKRQGSDIGLSDCHYDAPFKYIYQGGNVFLRAILALNENNTVYTQVEDKTSLLSTGDYNVIRYNEDYHCVHGSIPANSNRILLKIHFIAIPPDTNPIWSDFCRYINNNWTHFSREMMRDSIKPETVQGYFKQYLVLISGFTWNNINIILIIFAFLILVFWKRKSIAKWINRRNKLK
jgi:hypothetical protein